MIGKDLLRPVPREAQCTYAFSQRPAIPARHLSRMALCAGVNVKYTSHNSMSDDIEIADPPPQESRCVVSGDTWAVICCTGIAAIVEGCVLFLDGHTSKTVLYWYGSFMVFVALYRLVGIVAGWREESRAMHKNVKVLARRLKIMNYRLEKVEQKLRNIC